MLKYVDWMCIGFVIQGFGGNREPFQIAHPLELDVLAVAIQQPCGNGPALLVGDIDGLGKGVK